MPWFALAPAASSAATTSVCPFCAAMMSGVTPSVRADEKGGGTQQGGAREPQAERESNETGGRLERKEKEDNRRAPASLSVKEIWPLLSQLWKKKKYKFLGHFAQTLQNLQPKKNEARELGIRGGKEGKGC